MNIKFHELFANDILNFICIEGKIYIVTFHGDSVAMEFDLKNKIARLSKREDYKNPSPRMIYEDNAPDVIKEYIQENNDKIFNEFLHITEECKNE